MCLDELEIKLHEVLKFKQYKEREEEIKELKNDLKELEQEHQNYLEINVKPIKDAIMKKFDEQNLSVYSSLIAKRVTKTVIDTKKLAEVLSPGELLSVSNVVLKRLSDLQDDMPKIRSDKVQECLIKEQQAIKDINLIK